MPELPEVETIARGLDAKLRRKTIAGVDIAWPKTFDGRGDAPESLVGDRIVRVERIGKQVGIRLSSGRTLAVHLRMTGRLLVVGPTDEVPYERASLRFSEGTRLAFGDARKFGRMRLIEGDPASALEIGIDPFDARLDSRAMAALLRGRKTPIKVWMLDQRRLGGVGNIYASEALYRARIRPRRKSQSLTGVERSRLLRSLRWVLKKAIAARGSSVDDYVDAEGMKGGFQNLLTVYGRAGLPCRRCRAPIQRIVLAQRATFFCPVCQR